MHLVEPERLLLAMRVEMPQYILRKPLVVPDRDRLLQETEDPLMRQMWFTTKAYKAAALELILREVNQVSRRLALPEMSPIQASNLTEISMATPFVADRLGRFGGIATEAYSYSAFFSNKLSWVAKNFHSRDEKGYLGSIKARYAMPKSKINTNAAYMMASQWLAAAYVDVHALEREYKVRVMPWDLGDLFVPLYRVTWEKEEGRAGEIAATVELLEPEHQMPYLALQGCHFRGRRGLKALTIIGQGGGVQRIGFGPFSLGFGGCADVSGVDDRDGDVGVVEGLGHGRLVAACGLADDMRLSQGA